MTRLTAGGVLVLVALVALGGNTADAKTYCQKATARKGTKIVARTDGVTVSREGRAVSACSDAKRVSLGLYIMDPGYKVAKVVATKHRCVAILFTAKGKLPSILFKDLAGKMIGSALVQVGFNQPAATVGSLSMSTNCAAAWGESVSDGAGGTVYRVRVKSLSSANALPDGVTTEVATVAAADDIAHVKAAASGKQVRVSWTLAGAPQSATLPLMY
jgi:hypothetical protein